MEKTDWQNQPDPFHRRQRYPMRKDCAWQDGHPIASWLKRVEQQVMNRMPAKKGRKAKKCMM